MDVDFAIVVLTALAVVVSVIAMCLSFIAAQKGNSIATAATELTRTTTELQKGQVEMQIREMISSARGRYEDLSIQLEGAGSNPVLKAAIGSASENYLNAYDEACAKYLDGKVDKIRFKKLYHDEIRQLVNNPNFQDKYREPNTKFHATNKVYKEWNNLEE